MLLHKNAKNIWGEAEKWQIDCARNNNNFNNNNYSNDDVSRQYRDKSCFE